MLLIILTILFSQKQKAPLNTSVSPLYYAIINIKTATIIAPTTPQNPIAASSSVLYSHQQNAKINFLCMILNMTCMHIVHQNNPNMHLSFLLHNIHKYMFLLRNWNTQLNKLHHSVILTQAKLSKHEDPSFSPFPLLICNNHMYSNNWLEYIFFDKYITYCTRAQLFFAICHKILHRGAIL